MLEKFISWLIAQVGFIYVWGGQGETNITEAWIRKMENSTENANRAIAFWNKQRAAGVKNIAAFDCSGLIVKFMLDNKLRTNDTTAQGLYNESVKLSSKTNLATGDLVFRQDSSGKIYHVGVYIGNGDVIHAMGRDVGVVRQHIDANGTDYWNKFGIIQKLKESKGETTTMAKKLKITSPLMRGEDIKALQTALNALGYPCGTADGVCGNNTMSAVQAFSKEHGSGSVPIPTTMSVTVTVDDTVYTGSVKK